MDQYKDIFLSEAREHLDALDAGLILLEKDPKNPDASTELMRHAHTLKGIAASMEFGQISNLAHSFEGMVENIKNAKASADGVSLLFGAVDELRSLIAGVESGEVVAHQANELVDKVGELEHSDLREDARLVEKPETFRHVQEVKVKTEKLDKMVDLSAEILISRLRLEEYLRGAIEQDEVLQEVVENHNRLVDELQYQTLKLRLTPLVHVFNRFPRMVRDLAEKEKKSVDFKMMGGDIELDRSILDGLGEPLVHLLRNAVDHGIEKEGSLYLSAERDKDYVLISVHNTGNSIDWEEIESRAKELGRWEEGMSREDMLFSGISTAEKVTEVSGRGVGLYTVREKVDELDGYITVDSEQGEGTKFTLHLPVSLAIIKALIVDSCEQTFAVPLSSVERLVEVRRENISNQADQAVTIIDGNDVPLVDIDNILGICDNKGPSPLEQDAGNTVLLTKHRGMSVGIVIDTVSSQQDIIVKSLTKELRKQGVFSAVTILGDGNPVPILDLESIISKL